MTLFDTDVLIEYLRGNQKARPVVEEAVREGRAACSVVTRFELLAGMRSNERHAVRGLLDAISSFDVTWEIADRAGEWARTYRRSHTHIAPIDYLIAATAEIEGANLATLNVRHYPMYPDLSPAF